MNQIYYAGVQSSTGLFDSVFSIGRDLFWTQLILLGVTALKCQTQRRPLVNTSSWTNSLFLSNNFI